MADDDEDNTSQSEEEGRPSRDSTGQGEEIPCPPGMPAEIRKRWSSLSQETQLRIVAQVSGKEIDRIVKYHPGKSLNKDLFDPKQCLRWIDRSLLAALADWRESKATREERFSSTESLSLIDLEALPGCIVEAPGIISFPAFNDEFCEALLAEVKHYRACKMPSRAPNSMNNYGLVLNEIGMRPVFDALLAEVFQPLGALFFGDDEHRAHQINGKDTGTENWGGSSLDDHHSFIVQYRPEDDKHLDMHIDECDVTFNFGITPPENFEGNDLTFCGMMDSQNHRQYHHMYKHIKGRCVVHSGKRRHGALDIEKGERSSLIMWTKSRSFRKTPEYRLRSRTFVRNGPADRVCLSYTHDPDYKTLMPKKLQYQMVPKPDEDATSLASASTQAASTEKRWVRICGSDELQEGTAKMISFEADNEQVAVFRHRGELFALDNRCAHMGGPLCEGDIEDLGLRAEGADNPQDGVVKCPRHGMCFNIRTGENINGGHMKQRTYPVRLANGDRDVELEVELEVTAGSLHEKSSLQQPPLEQSLLPAEFVSTQSGDQPQPASPSRSLGRRCTLM